MTSRLKLYIFPTKGIDIEWLINENDEDVTSTSSRRSINHSFENMTRYRIKNLYDIDKIDDDCTDKDSVEGMISPRSQITLPTEIRKGAGIPQEAARYGYIHPPENLATRVNQRTSIYQNDRAGESWNDNETMEYQDLSQNAWAIAAFATFGGFIYFDKKDNILSINIVTIRKTKYTLEFAGPFKANQTACDTLKMRNRVAPISHRSFHEVGFVGISWARVGETYLAEPATDYHSQRNGALMLFRIDGSAVVIVVKSSKEENPLTYIGSTQNELWETRNMTSIDDEGNIDLLTLVDQKKILTGSEYEVIIQLRNKNGRVASFSQTNYCGPNGDFDILVDAFSTAVINSAPSNTKAPTFVLLKWRKWKQLFDEHEMSYIDTNDNKTEDPKSVICKIDNAIMNKETYVLSRDERRILETKDEYGWKAFFYVCQYHSKRLDLIKYLLRQFPNVVTEQDDFGRCPLAIACASDPSENVIMALLKADTSKQSVFIKSKLHEYLPLHFAVNNNASKSVIKALLRADKDGRTVTSKAMSGALPLHIAIERFMHPNIIQLLLDKDTPDRYSSNSDLDINQVYNGKLPLHIACMNESSPQTIALLLQKDKDMTTTSKAITFPLYERLSNEGKTINRMNKTVALHIALIRGSSEAVKLILLAEEQKMQSAHMPSIVVLRDSMGRSPLHIACAMESIEASVVKLLLDADKSKETIYYEDQHKATPLHAVCDSKKVSTEKIQLILEAERQYELLNGHHKDAAQLADGQGKCPFYHAVQGDAPETAIALLLDDEFFCSKGFDNSLIRKLARTVASSDYLQETIIDAMSDRQYCGIILLQLYVNTLSFVAFLFMEEYRYHNNPTVGNMHWSIVALWFCIAMDLLREIGQLRLEGFTKYITDPWSWLENSKTFLVISVLLHIRERESDRFNTTLMIAASTATIAVTIIYLRSVFLPFARFVGGFLAIFVTLVPFIVTTLLLILLFSNIFFLNGNENCENQVTCFTFHLNQMFSGPVDGSSIEQILFATVIVIVLLNVVIAIVSDAWEDSKRDAKVLFFESRIQLYAQIRTLYRRKRGRISDIGSGKENLLHRFLDWIDRFEGIKYKFEGSWAEYPYNLVMSKEEYDNPEKYFDRKIASQIYEIHSLEADLHFLRTNAIHHEPDPFAHCILILKLWMKWFVSLMTSLLCFILGLVTTGILWPRSVRKRILAAGIFSESF